MQRDALRHRGIDGHLTGVALVDVGQLDAVAGRILNVGDEALDRRSIADIGRRNVQGEEMAQRAPAMCTFDPRLRLALS